ncbi:MAG: hypothetical protein M1817_002537 [Caeruleum heppii]|nr:MAG: hypothetical protein M1817_002537 [Caeruleum heppii]
MDDLPSWPAWNFGLVEEDLFTTLQDQFNTFPSVIQDKEAFFHDVLEISTAAKDRTQLEAMLDERRKLRLFELKEALSFIAARLIGEPSLLGESVDQWLTASELFRSLSLAALVQYFASFLPPEPDTKLQPCPETSNAHKSTPEAASWPSSPPPDAPLNGPKLPSSRTSNLPQQSASLPFPTSTPHEASEPNACSIVEIKGRQTRSQRPTERFSNRSFDQRHGLRRSRRIAEKILAGRVQKQPSRAQRQFEGS